jgi:hypothetical protein
VEIGDQISDPEGSTGEQNLRYRIQRSQGARQHLPGGPARSHEVTRQRLVEPLQRAEVAGPDRAFTLGIKGLGPRVQVTGSLQASPGAPVADDEQGHPGAGVVKLGAQLHAYAGRLVVADRLKAPATSVPRLVKKHGAEADGQRRGIRTRARDRGCEHGPVQPAGAEPGA